MPRASAASCTPSRARGGRDDAMARHASASRMSAFAASSERDGNGLPPVHVRLRARASRCRSSRRSRSSRCRRPRTTRSPARRSAFPAGSHGDPSRRCPGRRAGRWRCVRAANRPSTRPRASCPPPATARAAPAAPGWSRCRRRAAAAGRPCAHGRHRAVPSPSAPSASARARVAAAARVSAGRASARFRSATRASHATCSACARPSAVRSVRDWPCERRAPAAGGADERAVRAREAVEQIESLADVGERARRRAGRPACRADARGRSR